MATKRKVPAKKAPPKKAAKKATVKAKAVKMPAKKLMNWLSPLEDRVVVSLADAPEMTAGGIIIPGSTNERPSRGEVVAKGPGRRNKKGALRPLDVSVGDEVLFAEYSGTKITLEAQDFLILREEDLLGIVT